MIRFLRLLMVLAMLVSPLAMAGGAPAHAAPVAAASGHCPDRDRPAPDQPGASIDCAIACAAIPAAGGSLPAPRPTSSRLEPPPPLSARDGLAPEAATPPPRSD